MNAKLVYLDAEDTPTEIVLDRFPLLVGRSQDAELQLFDSWVSRFHCMLDVIDGSLVVRDLGSCNGTLVNGVPITESPLRPQDELTIGSSTFRADY
jgi:pSer/pThr/pTyr-binding forkhead associated (FHA) protein